MNRIEMACDQNARLALFGMREAGADAAGKTLPACDALDAGTHDRHIARGDVEHTLRDDAVVHHRDDGIGDLRIAVRQRLR